MKEVKSQCERENRQKVLEERKNNTREKKERTKQGGRERGEGG